MKFKLLGLFLVLPIIFVEAEEKVSYRNSKYVEFDVKNEKQFDAVKALEFDSRVSWIY
jgi:hypothetical protein